MTGTSTKRHPTTRLKTAKPRLHKVILLNDDYTPREFVVGVLAAIFHMSQEESYHAMITAHSKGSCVIAVYTQEIAETKASQATEAGRKQGFPLTFSTEPEE